MARTSKALKAARADASFMRALKGMCDVPKAPKWPFERFTEDDWNSLPYRIQRNLEQALIDYTETSKRD